MRFGLFFQPIFEIKEIRAKPIELKMYDNQDSVIC